METLNFYHAEHVSIPDRLFQVLSGCLMLQHRTGKYITLQPLLDFIRSEFLEGDSPVNLETEVRQSLQAIHRGILDKSHQIEIKGKTFKVKVIQKHIKRYEQEDQQQWIEYP